MKTYTDRLINALQFIEANNATPSDQTRLLNGHDLLTFDIGEISQSIKLVGRNAYM
jgi:hypothetical protein